MLRDAWDNVASLQGYAGPIEIFGARDDAVIPIGRARALARQIPGAQFIEITGRHGEWAQEGRVKIRR
jgi:pimeloyl-ACP methyl ester carboxylesterase